ncbi:MAG TPA: hydroxyisourate hydrolase [Longimicrobiaceae bacterium]|nr:hydroxyisourate hydrolase [Longimicrobiaceae bacterium]
MPPRSPVTTHILDTARGRPAAGVGITLDVADGDGWRELANGVTDGDGRIEDLLAAGEPLRPGVYRLTFAVETPFYPEIAVVFRVDDPTQHYHVPLLLSPFGFSTYRGS